MAALQRAAEDAVEPQHVTAIMRRAVRMALEGNLSAMRFVIDRVCGKVAEASVGGTPLELALPNLRTVGNCVAAIDKLTAGICDGSIDRDAAKLLLDVVQARLKAIEANDLEERLAELERQASVVDFRARRN